MTSNILNLVKTTNNTKKLGVKTENSIFYQYVNPIMFLQLLYLRILHSLKQSLIFFGIKTRISPISMTVTLKNFFIQSLQLLSVENL